MSKKITTPNRYLVTEKAMPKILENKGRYMIKSVRVPEFGGYDITIVDRDEIKYSGSGRFNKSDVYGFIYMDRIFINIPKDGYKVSLLKRITIDAIFENPIDLESFTDDNGNYMYNTDTDAYPINDAMWEYIQGAIISNRYEVVKETEDDNRDEAVR